MEPLLIILVPGILGGLAIAALILLLQRRGARQPSHVEHLQPVSPHLINMASIRVAGVGGLGLVAMAVAVALGIPRIAQTEAVGLALGAVGAVIVILRRRRTGVLPSSGQGLGANTILRLDGSPEPSRPRQDHSSPIQSFAPVTR